MRKGSNMFRSVREATWLYPLKGLIYCATRRAFWPLFGGRIIPIVFLSAFILALLFTFAYLPQVAFLLIFHKRGAWFNAAVLVLGEGAAVVALLFEAFFADEILVDVFDAVLVNEGLGDLISEARAIDSTAPNCVKMLGKPTISSVYAPFSLRQIVEFVILLPVTFIPFVGVPIFLILTGYRAGPFQHWRYFKLMGFSRKERREFIRHRQLKYTYFGTVALLLQLVPVLSMFFLLTTAAGSALWVVKIEKTRRLRETAAAPSVQEPYEDEPAGV